LGHHYVPRFLLREWVSDVRNQRVLQGYYYDHYAGALRVRQKGENFFCNVPDLFTVRGLPAGDDAIERIFFKDLDDAAAIAHQMLLRGDALNPRQRLDFVRLLLSLEARYPRMVSYIRQRGAKNALRMNSDPEIRQLLDEWGDYRPANVVWDKLVGFSSEDQAMETVQKLTTNERIGRALTEASWGILRRPEGCDQFVLGDRPLIRIKGQLARNNIWILPISPNVVWFCAMGPETFEMIGRIPPRRFGHLINGWSALQADKYVFSVRETPLSWLERRLKR
jgi:hypothetical protein